MGNNKVIVSTKLAGESETIKSFGQKSINFIPSTGTPRVDSKEAQKVEIELLVSIRNQISKGIDVYPHLSKILSSNIKINSLFWSNTGIKEKRLVNKGEDLAKILIAVFKDKKSPTPEAQKDMSNLVKSAYIISDHVPVHIKERILKSMPEEKHELLQPFIETQKTAIIALLRSDEKSETTTEIPTEKKITLSEIITSFNKTMTDGNFGKLQIDFGQKGEKFYDELSKLLDGETGNSSSSPNSFTQLLKKLHFLKINPFGGTKFARGSYKNKTVLCGEKELKVYHAGSSSSYLRINYYVNEGVIHVIEFVRHLGGNTFEPILTR